MKKGYKKLQITLLLRFRVILEENELTRFTLICFSNLKLSSFRNFLGP